jgi:hypothetical protein
VRVSMWVLRHTAPRPRNRHHFCSLPAHLEQRIRSASLSERYPSSQSLLPVYGASVRSTRNPISQGQPPSGTPIMRS